MGRTRRHARGAPRQPNWQTLMPSAVRAPPQTSALPADTQMAREGSHTYHSGFNTGLVDGNGALAVPESDRVWGSDNGEACLSQQAEEQRVQQLRGGARKSAAQKVHNPARCAGRRHHKAATRLL